jgi:putative cell wall-binding protein
LALAIAVVAGVASLTVGPWSAEPAQAVSGNDFNPGYIVSDQNFYDKNAMSVADIQAFLVAHEPAVCAGDCLKNHRETTPTVAANLRCTAYNGAANESAATIIYRIAQTCGISPKTLLVTLQKEQSLVTASAPTSGAYRAAMGAGCPDTAACDSNYYGFFNQLRYGARLFKAYADVTSYPVGKPSAIRYNPNAACGAQTVTIQNQATHALYVYTPYVPNAAALANLGRTGDGCSSYGNLNFWRFWNQWFGSPTTGSSPYGAVTATSSTQGSLMVHGWAVDPDTKGSIRVDAYIDGKGAASTTANLSDPALGESAMYSEYYGDSHAFTFNLTGIAPGSHQLCVFGINAAGPGGNTLFICQSVTVAWCGTTITCPTTSRIGADNRYEESTKIAAQAFPSGARLAYVASGDNFPDALSVGPLAATAGAPVLLTAAGSLPAPVSAALTSLGVTKVVILGGTDTVAPAVESALDALLGSANVTRIAGSDRTATSRLIASSSPFPATFPQVYVTNGYNYPDAISAASVASIQHAPVILVNGAAATADAATLQFLRSKGVTKVTILGQDNSVSAGIEKAIAALPGVTVTRLGGSDRFVTSHLVTRSFFTGTSAKAYLTTGYNFPDGLVGSMLAVADHAPVLMAATTCLPTTTVSDLKELGVKQLTLLGGPTTLSDSIQTALTPC